MQVKDAKPMVTQATRPEFGDYQCNAALPLSKSLAKKPREVSHSVDYEGFVPP